jgi:hypothetical protein
MVKEGTARQFPVRVLFSPLFSGRGKANDHLARARQVQIKVCVGDRPGSKQLCSVIMDSSNANATSSTTTTTTKVSGTKIDAETISRIQPQEYFRHFSKKRFRPDGRAFSSFRRTTLSLGMHSHNFQSR